MNQYANMIRNLKSPEAVERLMHLYGNRDGMLVEQTARYTGLVKRHEELFHETERKVLMISAPGRTEIGGNHTDHNRGRVLAAAVNLDTLSAVSARDDKQVHIYSDGYAPLVMDLSDLSVVEAEKGTTAALVRGVAARMQELGYKIGGFNAAVTSSVASGSGLSSSAAFEVMTCAILDALYNDFTIDYITRAKISQYAENVYFGKPSGLLDQMASSAGGLVTVDFRNEDPDVRAMNFDFSAYGYSLVVVATGGSHADLTDDYAAIPAEMKQVAACFGEPYLRRVRPDEFYQALPGLRGKVSDRALMRAMHFFEEDERVVRQVAALDRKDLFAFMWEIICSGRSSYMYLQNVYARTDDQSLSLALAMAEQMLVDKDGAWRIHGGGFAGTTLNFVPNAQLNKFIETMEAAFGTRCCHVLDIRPEGAAVLKL
ncbi:MAG: galactokinase [Clostridia bacterium]|nr:galactokinase [Clostridia bacterium]